MERWGSTNQCILAAKVRNERKEKTEIPCVFCDLSQLKISGMMPMILRVADQK